MSISNERKAQMRDKVRDNFGAGKRYPARALAEDLHDAVNALDELQQTITGLTADRGTTIGSLGAWDIGKTVAFEWQGTYMRGQIDDVHAHHDRIVRYGEGQDWAAGRARTSVNLTVGGHQIVLIAPDTPCEVIA